MQAAAAQHAQNAGIITTFASRAKEAAIATGATLEIAEATEAATTTDAETSFADAIAMQK